MLDMPARGGHGGALCAVVQNANLRPAPMGEIHFINAIAILSLGGGESEDDDAIRGTMRKLF